MHSFLVYGVILSISSHLAFADTCPCGYVDNNGNVWRESIVTNFTQSAGALAALGNDWIISTDNQTQDTGPKLLLQYVTDNVFQNNGALGIKTSAYNGNGTVLAGEIFTVVSRLRGSWKKLMTFHQRSDILYGTFRTRAVVPTVPGVVFGFFTWGNDTQEQDIEIVTADPLYYQDVQYTNQPGQLPNSDPDPDAHKEVSIPGADFRVFGEHRIDWFPQITNYYYNQQQTSSISKNVPFIGSEVILNVWSNGDGNFSQGPPTQDAIATAQWVQLYFNSTSLSQDDFTSTCSAAGNVPQCVV